MLLLILPVLHNFYWQNKQSKYFRQLDYSQSDCLKNLLTWNPYFHDSADDIGEMITSWKV